MKLDLKSKQNVLFNDKLKIKFKATFELCAF